MRLFNKAMKTVKEEKGETSCVCPKDIATKVFKAKSSVKATLNINQNKEQVNREDKREGSRTTKDTVDIHY